MRPHCLCDAQLSKCVHVCGGVLNIKTDKMLSSVTGHISDAPEVLVIKRIQTKTKKLPQGFSLIFAIISFDYFYLFRLVSQALICTFSEHVYWTCFTCWTSGRCVGDKDTLDTHPPLQQQNQGVGKISSPKFLEILRKGTRLSRNWFVSWDPAGTPLLERTHFPFSKNKRITGTVLLSSISFQRNFSFLYKDKPAAFLIPCEAMIDTIILLLFCTPWLGQGITSSSYGRRKIISAFSWHHIQGTVSLFWTLVAKKGHAGRE